MGQKNGEKWVAAVGLQPTIPKSDRRTPVYVLAVSSLQSAMFLLQPIGTMMVLTPAPVTPGSRSSR